MRGLLIVVGAFGVVSELGVLAYFVAVHIPLLWSSKAQEHYSKSLVDSNAHWNQDFMR